VGLPFFFLSANAPLIQSWYARSGGTSASDPYFLYGASNLGSLLALLAFPLVAEPLFGARQIGMGWMSCFVVLGGLLALTGYLARHRTAESTDIRSVTSPSPSALKMVRWAALAFIPSSMMLAITTQLAMDKGSIPLIWVVPLALYLLTFVVTFTNRALLSDRLLRLVFLVSMVWLSVVFSKAFFVQLDWPKAGLMIAAFFGLSIYAHRKLYEERPEGAQLTLFYLVMSVGGALGGLFNSIIAPIIFIDIYEGIATLLVAALVLTNCGKASPTGRADMPRGLLRPVAVAFIAVSALILLTTFQPHNGVLHKSRSFFGSHLVQDSNSIRMYTNGTTLHGGERVADLTSPRPEPLYYYHRLGPIGQLLLSDRGREAVNVGVVGLGVGAMACYSQAHQNWHFYEIDAQVDRIARDPTLFTFLSACAPSAPTHLGDARVVLAQQEAMNYDLLIIDAYSSDSVPVHLTTTEAMELYMDRLSPRGVLLYHISNHYYDLSIPLARSAASLGLSARFQHYLGSSDPEGVGDTPTTAVIIARDTADFGDLGRDPRWTPLVSDGGNLWTDDHSNLLSVMRNH
jgi:hypothetical protein